MLYAHKHADSIKQYIKNILHIYIYKIIVGDENHSPYALFFIFLQSKCQELGKSIQTYFQQSIAAAPLAVFRIIFGCFLAIIVFRTGYYGWIEKFYIAPSFFFKFYGFGWVEPLPPIAMYSLFGLLFIAAIFIILGYFYRIATFFFFIGFTYAELLDVTHYLNHHYLVSILCFWMIFLPAHRTFSLDVFYHKANPIYKIPKWVLDGLKLQIALVYFFAGIAKIQYDWLIEAQPMRLWMLHRSNLPVIGSIIVLPYAAHIMSWAGMLYDLSISFLLWGRRTWKIAYLGVLIFHIFTKMLFHIGIFPFLMIGITTIFFPPFVHQKIIRKFASVFNLTLSKLKLPKERSFLPSKGFLVGGILFLLLQILLPLRHHLYPGNVLWTEEGFRFSWKVMVMEKRGQIDFLVRDSQSNRESRVQVLDYLTEKQVFMMSTQPDLILQFAHFLHQHYEKRADYVNPIVTVDAFVSLNGRRSQRFIQPHTNLAKESQSLWPKIWILPLKH